MENKELWDKVAKMCLRRVITILEKEATPTSENFEAAEKYIAIAEKSEGINLHWAAQSRYGAAVFPNQPFSRR